MVLRTAVPLIAEVSQEHSPDFTAQASLVAAVKHLHCQIVNRVYFSPTGVFTVESEQARDHSVRWND